MDILHQNQINKVGLYLRSFGDKLYLVENEFNQLPAEIEPTSNLSQYTRDYSDNIYIMERGNYHFYLCGNSKKNIDALIVTANFYNQVIFWESFSTMLFFYNLIRKEKLKSESKNPLVYVDKKTVLISGELTGFPQNVDPGQIKQGKINIDDDTYICESYDSKWKLPGELIYKLIKQGSINNSKLNLYESLLQIKKYGQILSNDLDKDSVYSTEISTINRLLKRIIEDIEQSFN
ncbi:MAG: hypothetical protein APR63_02010 [Desulfuromonas sp. SDB]|nr:MAG: hypothetical protein APR63_02010 [Desulfuromonas sp. SDB]